MLRKLTSAAILFSALIVSYNSIAATELSASASDKGRVKMGEISVEIVDGTMTDAMSRLSKEADDRGASAYKIIDAERLGMGGNLHVHAEIFK